ncbi:MAG TPA: PBP1A family penicillin-binding protein [Patescibacteria group bacterium]|nr:PBP1A family penicillin-binding protein [Patescibacteria group bacterium]
MAIYHADDRFPTKENRFLRFVRAQKTSPWKTAAKTLLIIVSGLAIIGVFVFALVAAWISRDLPDPNTLTTRQVPQSTKIYDRTGTHLLYELHGDEKRTLVKITDLPVYVKQATIAIEDKDFYQHHGVYWKGIVRAVWTDLTHGKLQQGASTLTQQLVKNALLTNEKTITRKIKEFLLAIQIERVYSKDQILQMYLNEIPYGATEYGIESAAQTYFGKSSKDLTLDEAALLASIPQSTDYYNPYGTGAHGDNRQALVTRQHRVLDLMVEQKFISRQQAEDAKKIDTLKKLVPKTVNGSIQAPHFVMYVRSLLTEKYGQKMVEQGGLKVITTLDWDKQMAAEDEIKKGVDARGKQYKFSNAALVSLDPTNGQILAMVGSKDFFDTANDGQVNVTLRPRQPGSSFKPIVYAVGFMKGFLPDTTLWDVNTTFKTDTKPYQPHDYDLKERGPVSIRQALQGSLNIPAVEMLYLDGVGRVLDFAETLGYTTLSDRSRFGLSLVLGGGEVTPIEHANAYAAFADEGIHYPTSAILEVDDPNGTTLEKWQQPEGTRVMDPQISRLISNVLSDNAARAYIFGAQNYLTLPDRPVAVKTGTTNDYHDAWTVGYTPNLVTAVWVGNNNNDAMKRGADGSIVAAPIWQGYMKRATKDLPIQTFTQPDPPTTDKPALLGKAVQQTIQIDTVSGLRATEYTPLEDIVNQTFYEAHTILYYVDKDDPTGPPPSNPADDPQFANWEAAVQSWVQRTGWHTTSTAPTGYDNVHVPGTQPQISISQPANNQTINARDLSIAADVSSQRTITRVEASLDGVPLGTLSGSPFILAAHIPDSIDAGTHQLTIRAFDDLGNAGTASESVNLTAARINGPQITIDAPAPETSWSRASFPHVVDVHAIDPTIYPHIDVSFIGSDGINRSAGSEMNPNSNPIHIQIPLGPPAGRYLMVVSGTTSDGSRTDTAQLYVTITE